MSMRVCLGGCVAHTHLCSQHHIRTCLISYSIPRLNRKRTVAKGGRTRARAYASTSKSYKDEAVPETTSAGLLPGSADVLLSESSGSTINRTSRPPQALPSFAALSPTSRGGAGSKLSRTKHLVGRPEARCKSCVIFILNAARCVDPSIPACLASIPSRSNRSLRNSGPQ